MRRSILLMLPICLSLLSSASASHGALMEFLEAESASTLSGAAAFAVSPDGLYLYVVSTQANSLVVLQRDATTGLLTFVEAEVDGTGGVDGMRQPQAVGVSPDGSSVYTISRADSAIALFSRNAVSGQVTFVEAVLNGTDGIEGIWQGIGLAMDPLGEFVVGSGRKSPSQPKGSVALFNRNPMTGQLTIADYLYDTLMGTTGLGNGASVTVSPEGAHVYAASASGNSVVVFEIDRSAGSLSYLETESQGVAGVGGLTGASDVIVSPDGSFVYVTGATDNAVVTFSRDSETGDLDYLGMVSGLTGLIGASGVSVSPSGESLVTSGAGDNSVALFSRDTRSGQIVWSEAQTDGVAGVTGLAGASSAGVSPDGLHIYATGPGASSVVAFGRGIGFDFGDAPDPTFPTLLAADGARHVIVPGLFLGSGVDAESDGQPAASADGDDLAGIDDENGVVFATPLIPGQEASVDVEASAAGALEAWIDFDGDGDWLDAGEQIAESVAVGTGTTSVPFVVPPTAVPDSSVLARFRLRSSMDPPNSPTGLANSGEVEDYQTSIGVGADLDVVAVANTPRADWNEPFAMTVTVTNIGPNVVVGADVEILMTDNASGVTWSCVATDAACLPGGVGDIVDLVNIASGGSLEYTIEGTVVDQALGRTVTASASATVPSGVTDPVSSNNVALGSVVIVSIFLDGFESGDTREWAATIP